MKNLRVYGKPPYKVAVVHGGPGAPGEMAPVARELSSDIGVLEPLQTATSLDGQVEELRGLLEENGDPPITLIGWSWGAWLAFILAAEYPALVKKLILISSGPYEERYASEIMEARLNRLSVKERSELLSLFDIFENSSAPGNIKDMARFGKLISKADSYHPLPHDDEILEYQYDSLQDAGNQARQLRISGKLLDYGESIQCPVVAVHGDYDPHPYQGVRQPLSRVLKEFRFILLENCGHCPWFEREARDRFYQILTQELKQDA